MTHPTAHGDRVEGPIRVVLVDDQALVRAGFRMVLDAQPDMVVVGEAGDGLEALDLLERTPADVVLMDVRMPRLDGVSATQQLCRRADAPRVIILTTFDLDEYAYSALHAGAAGFLLKDAGPTDLLAAVRSVHHGDAVIAPSLTRRMLARFATQLPLDASPQATAATAGASTKLAGLTAREIEILTAVGQGLSNAEIAASFFLAEATVKTHIGHILAKCSLRDRVHMVLLAYETGLVRVHPGS